MLTEICAELRNYFEVPNGRHLGKFEISGGSIAPLDFLQEGQYFRIVGSVFNDGVWQCPTSELVDETFDGAIWAMAVPPDVVSLAEEIGAWEEKYRDAVESPYTSESFGGYSYTKRGSSARESSAQGADNAVSWQSVFRARLNRWRKL